MAGISLIDVDVGDALPVVALAAGAFGLYWLYRHVQAGNAASAAAQDPGAETLSDLYNQAEEASLLGSLFPPSTTPAQNTSTGTLTAPTTATANGSTNPAANATTPSPSTGNLAAPATGN